MLVQLFNRGRGKGAGPVQYTTLETVPAFDENGRRIPGETKTRIPPPEVLRGDPQMVERLIDSSVNEWKYSSGVVAFGDSDAPTEEEQREVMDDFERTFFAGLEPDQYSCLWVRHTHEGNTELHFVIPRLELVSGKALNPFPPGYMQMSDAWRDKWNHAKGWERPDDPSRMRLVRRPSYEEKIKIGKEDPRGEITAWLVSRIESGLIDDRADLVASLREIGEITREGKDYVSVKPEGFDKAIRLKGAIYGQDFQRERFISEAQREDAAGSTRESSIDLGRAREATERLAKHVQKRAQYNADRYPREPQEPPGRHGDVDGAGSADHRKNGSGSSAKAEQDHERALLESIENDQSTDRPGDREHRPTDIELERSEGRIKRDNESSRAISESQPQALDNGFSSGPERLSDYLARQLGPDSIFSGSSTAEPSSDQRATSNDQRPAETNTRVTDRPGTERDVSDTSARTPNRLRRWRHACDQITDRLRGGYERVRTAIIESIDRVERAVRNGYDAARGAEQSPQRASEQLVGAGRTLERSAQPVRAFLEKLDRSIGGSGVDEISQAIKRRLTGSGLPAKADSPAWVDAVEAPQARPSAEFENIRNRWARPK